MQRALFTVASTHFYLWAKETLHSKKYLPGGSVAATSAVNSQQKIFYQQCLGEQLLSGEESRMEWTWSISSWMSPCGVCMGRSTGEGFAAATSTWLN
ncbi:hypothetical protein Y1Q_0002777 [Alligator mississippiensis]|uniref:Uncharacterized protein n=1 Tax=Alligator mississippiensis TaxID=8496 RepID=A0A151NZ32_ALLMI|nr:hypothetical protein Y1Q_0002777 [Alligator mississippiensis]